MMGDGQETTKVYFVSPTPIVNRYFLLVVEIVFFGSIFFSEKTLVTQAKHVANDASVLARQIKHYTLMREYWRVGEARCEVPQIKHVRGALEASYEARATRVK